MLSGRTHEHKTKDNIVFGTLLSSFKAYAPRINVDRGVRAVVSPPLGLIECFAP
jgi:hypothetical protein